MIWLWACTSVAPPAPAPVLKPAPVPEKPHHLDLFRALEMRPIKREITQARIDLGEALFTEYGCVTCHPIDKGGMVPGTRTYHGSTANVPSVLNSALQEAQFWDGRVPTVERVGTLEPPKGLDAEYEAAFPYAHPSKSAENTGLALGSYLRRQLSPGAFDRYLLGEVEALTKAQIAGLDTFVEQGCPSCHMGQILGGNLNPEGRDNPEVRRKIPGLRNVARTAPYLSDGRVESLADAVQHERPLTPEQSAAIQEFLQIL